MSILISVGLFSLQMFVKRGSTKAAESASASADLEQPLRIATTPSPSSLDASADLNAAAPLETAHAPSDLGASNRNELAGIAGSSETKDSGNAQSSLEGRFERAPYAPDAVLTKSGHQRPRTQSAPAATYPAIPDWQPNVASAPAATPTVAEGPPPVGTPAAIPTARSRQVSGLFDRAGASRQPVQRPLQEFADRSAASDQGSPRANNVQLVDWNTSTRNSAAAANPAAAGQAPADTSVRNSLDAPGPMIVPGRTAARTASRPIDRPGADAPSTYQEPAPAAGSDVLAPAAQPADAQTAPAPPQSESQTAASLPAVPVQAVPLPTAATSPVRDSFDRRTRVPRSDASLSNAGLSNAGSPLAALDRTKVMSFQFRNAPWTVVLSEFAAETHLELRMQSIPRGQFNRMDSGRYTPSQTLSILNGELSRLGCQLRVEGNVLYCTAAATRSAALPAQQQQQQPARPSNTSWFPPQSSGIIGASGRY